MLKFVQMAPRRAHKHLRVWGRGLNRSRLVGKYPTSFDRGARTARSTAKYPGIARSMQMVT